MPRVEPGHVIQAYEIQSPDVVKSVRQRWLLSYWTRLRRDRALPLWSDLSMAELESCFDDLTIIDVLPDSGKPQFRIHDHGKNVGALFAGQCAGKMLVDTLPESARAPTLETYEYAATSRLPVFTVSKTSDAEGRIVLYERLLLPFSDFGDRVSRIIGFLEAISPEGSFGRQNLMTSARTATEFAIKAVLQTRAR